eukprot:GEMP01043003.1.p1 GENE.GEMP01043003.1~~GEMP01043003.1.p1  ORF type:complete len:207 (+),score=56.20 GEMP01043003.1:226-846(+)
MFTKNDENFEETLEKLTAREDEIHVEILRTLAEYQDIQDRHVAAIQQRMVKRELLDHAPLERELEELKVQQDCLREQLHQQMEQNKIAEKCLAESNERNTRLDDQIQDYDATIEQESKELESLITHASQKELEEFDEHETKKKNEMRIAFFQYATITGIHWEEPLDNGSKGYVCHKSVSSFDFRRYENDPVNLADCLWDKIESCLK